MLHTSVFAGSIQLVEKNYPQVSGVQIFNLAPQYHNQLDHYMKTLKENGVNTVFFRVFQNRGDRYHFNQRSKCKTGVYYKSEHACIINNTLEDVIRAAKPYDIKVFAWMATRSLTFLKKKYGYEQRFIKNNQKDDTYAANIFDRRVRRVLKGLFTDLAKYDIHGILIQDDYILKHNEGASSVAKRRFFVDHGIRLTSDVLYKSKNQKAVYAEWNQWKMKQLSGFLNEIKASVKTINPQIKFAVNVYYESAIYPDRGLAWYSQSIQRYLDLGFEYLAFMGYHEQISDELSISRFAAIQFIQKSINRMLPLARFPQRVMVKFQARSFDKERSQLPKKELNRLCSTIKEHQNISYVIVPFEKLEDLSNRCFQ